MKTMVRGTMLAVVLTSSAHAALVDNQDGTVSDIDSGLMWLQDANLANTLGFDPGGHPVDGPSSSGP